jgi:hypothetical protein
MLKGFLKGSIPENTYNLMQDALEQIHKNFQEALKECEKEIEIHLWLYMITNKVNIDDIYVKVYEVSPNICETKTWCHKDQPICSLIIDRYNDWDNPLVATSGYSFKVIKEYT